MIMSGTGADPAAPDLDVAIRQLLHQQADIQSRLSVLLAAQHGLEMPLELDMLRHKLRVLEELVDHYGMLMFFHQITRVHSLPHVISTMFACKLIEGSFSYLLDLLLRQTLWHTPMVVLTADTNFSAFCVHRFSIQGSCPLWRRRSESASIPV